MHEHASVKEIALAAKKASAKMATASIEDRDQALMSMAQSLRSNCDIILAENERDMNAARADGMEEGLLDRLMLDESRIEGMASALETLISLPDPLGQTPEHRRLTNGIDLTKVSVPLGVVAMVYEARPNVTADAAGICIKTGNSCVLRGGSAAQYSNAAIAHALHTAAQTAGMPLNCICAIETTDRRATDELMSLHGIVDVLIPRGGTGLIKHCVENSKVPVIETGTGNCHVYVESSANFSMARAIAVNAKCRRLGVCNAAETLLVDAAIAQDFLPEMMRELSENNILLHADETAFAIGEQEGIAPLIAATEHDWETEYLAAEMAIKCVSGVEEAIEHINRYGTKHSEAIVTENQESADAFCNAVDAAAVYVNVSTAFTDGGEFGMGAEIGISTQKLHARGPFALNALTSYKYVLRGEGQVRA
ncbi:MAG: glutamate-5-semialdehyde dehydrogenase [Raoultibacter sp.]|jgi:glutamate-5-semialdehyde dehydrogenase